LQQAQPVNTSALPFELQFKESYADIDSYVWSSPEQFVVMFGIGEAPAGTANFWSSGGSSLPCQNG
jgi:hypothetical protein